MMLVLEWKRREKSQMCLEKVKFSGASKRLGTAAHAELAVDVAEMLFHGASGDGEVSSGLLVGTTGRNAAQDFSLTWTQRSQVQRQLRSFPNRRWGLRVWKLCQQSTGVLWHELPGCCLVQEGTKRWSFVKEQTSISVCLSEVEGLGKLEKSLLCLTKGLMSQGLQQQDLDHASGALALFCHV